MKNNTLRQHVAISIAIVTLASFACKIGWEQFDQYFDAERTDLDGLIPQATEREQGELQALPSEGEFVSPVAPLGQPAAAPIAPQSAPASSGAPIITGIDFPSTIPADGTTYFGWISFTDADGDVNRIRLHVVHSTTPMIDAENPPGTLEGTASAGKYRMGFYCTIPSLHIMQVTLLDAAGNSSNPMDFSWECR